MVQRRGPPLKTENKDVERARRQFWQWYYKENRPMKEVKTSFDSLSKDLSAVTGESYRGR